MPCSGLLALIALLATTLPAHCSPGRPRLKDPSPQWQHNTNGVEGRTHGSSVYGHTPAAAAASSHGQPQASPQADSRHLLQRTPQQQCGNGTRRCGGKCVKKSITDPTACGRACVRCPEPAANGIATCSRRGVCGVSCDKGYERAPGSDAADCSLCGANTIKAAAGPGPCSRCPSGFVTRQPRDGQQPLAADHDEARDCVAPAWCGPGQQPDPSLPSSCRVCPIDTWKDRSGPDLCQPCPNGTAAPGPAAADHNSRDDDCLVTCGPGMQRDGVTPDGCQVCPLDTFRATVGPGPCSRCPSGSFTRQPRDGQQPSAADHDEASDCVVPVWCGPGQQPDPALLSSCRVCPTNTWKDRSGPDLCQPCPTGTAAPGPAAADHDSGDDCLLTCGPGMQRDGVTPDGCQVCPPNTFKAAAEPGPCSRCPAGARTVGNTTQDHDSEADCFAGGLNDIVVGNKGALPKAVADFGWELQRALNNSGKNGRGGRGGGTGSTGDEDDKRACLFKCNKLPPNEWDPEFSRRVARVAGAPAVYFSNNPAHVRSGVNLVSAVSQQGSCRTCVSHALASAAETAVAAALRVDAAGSRGWSISHAYGYYCGPGVQKSCGTGWDFEKALAGGVLPVSLLMNSSCLGGVDLVTDTTKLKDECKRVRDACPDPGFSCGSKSVSDGLAQIQQYIRQSGSVVTRINVTRSFLSFFRYNPAGIYNGTTGAAGGAPAGESSDPGLHAVQLIGYNNDEMYFLAKNSYGEDWGDGGFFKIAYGVADVGHPEDTFALTDCFTTSRNTATVAAWSDPWPVVADDSQEDCVLYTATEQDTISGIAEHFQVDILQFVESNTNRSVISTIMLGDPPRPEPQLQREDGWADSVFQVCNIPRDTYGRVASDPCTRNEPAYCNNNGQCRAGRCVCLAQYNGTFCEQHLDGVPLQRAFTLSNGEQYTLFMDPQVNEISGTEISRKPKLEACQQWEPATRPPCCCSPLQVNWSAAQQQCEAINMRLARLYSPLHASEVYKQVEPFTKDYEFWIGLNDLQKEGSFVWVAGNLSAPGTALDFSLWGAPFSGIINNQPDNLGNEDCVEVRKVYTKLGSSHEFSIHHEWIDRLCDVEKRMFLCSSADESSDACVRFPCSTAGPGRPRCVTAPPDSSSSFGRECVCDVAAHIYVSDEVGCSPPLVFDKPFQFALLGGVPHVLYFDRATWTEADRICRDAGMSLAKLTSKKHADQLHEIVLKQLAGKGFVSGEASWYWIGLNDRATEGTFVWSSDGAGAVRTSFTRWAERWPDDGDRRQDCAIVWGSGNWDDDYCWRKAPFVCSGLQ